MTCATFRLPYGKAVLLASRTADSDFAIPRDFFKFCCLLPEKADIFKNFSKATSFLEKTLPKNQYR